MLLGQFDHESVVDGLFEQAPQRGGAGHGIVAQDVEKVAALDQVRGRHLRIKLAQQRVVPGPDKGERSHQRTRAGAGDDGELGSSAVRGPAGQDARAVSPVGTAAGQRQVGETYPSCSASIRKRRANHQE